MFGANKHGWIGIDVGASTVSLAQLGRRQGRIELTAAASVDRTTGEDRVAALRNDIETVLAVAGELHGKRAAAMLSMSSCRLEPGQAPVSQKSGDASGADEPCCASWPTGVESRDPDAGWYTLSADHGDAKGLSDELLRAGLSCQALDGAPLAIARAAGMVAPPNGDASSALAAIDWGWSSATFCSVIGGYPVYVRTLKNCGLANAAKALSAELGMTEGEARDALTKHPPAAPGAKADGDPLGDELAGLVRPLFDRMLAEVQRTLSHLQTHRRQASPTSICLLGGGSMLPGVARWLGRETCLPTSVWQPPGAAESRRDWSLLGPVIALSALAWEAK